MTCHSRLSWTALLFSSIHVYTKLLHHQMFTCMFAADEGSLPAFQHVNSLAMDLNMSLWFPGSPQSLPDGTVAQKTEFSLFFSALILLFLQQPLFCDVRAHNEKKNATHKRWRLNTPVALQ